MLEPTPIEILGATLFGCAVVHTFLVGRILDFSRRFEKGSPAESVLHFAGEIEVVFGVWGAFLLILMGLSQGFGSVVEYQNRLHFTEPIFVFCIMVIAATKPVLWLAQKLIQSLSAVLAKATRVPQTLMDVFTLLVIGPLSGSFITEPAAMTVTALLLARMVHKVDAKLMYALLAVLFVNVSIGGALTPYAAPPILMVAQKWGWDLATVFGHFGWKAACAVMVNSLCLTVYFKNVLQTHVQPLRKVSDAEQIPVGVILLHYGFLVVLVLCAHYPALAMGVFLFFLGMTTVTKKYQDRIRLKEALLVAFFLAGIIVFGPLQAWWLTPLLQSMGQTTLFLGATALTAITDNAALTFLGSQVEGLSEMSKYYLVAGAIAGGGLTIIANAPNAAGFSILQDKFQSGVHPGRLLKAALLPTLVAVLFLGFLPGCMSAGVRKPRAAASDEVLFQSQTLVPEGTFPRSIDGPALDLNGNLYVANFEKRGQVGYLAHGSTVMLGLFTLPDGGASAALRFDQKGQLFIADFIKHRIYKYDTAQNQLALFADVPDMNQPNDFVIARDGSLFLSDPSWNSKKPGQLWKISPDGVAQRLLTGVRAINGIDLSPDESKLYFTESISGHLMSYDLNGPADEGPRRVMSFAGDSVDGIRTDAQGTIYVVRIKEGKIDRVSARGELLASIPLMGREPTNLSFGGPDGRTLVITMRDTRNIEVMRVDQPGRETALPPL